MSARGKVVVVDDDPLVLKITQARLESVGFDVVLRDRPLGTSQAIMDERPDVVMLDMKMPALNGDALAELMRSNPETSGIPIILHSSMDLSSLQERARHVGALGAIAKTEDDRLFLAQFERLFERAKARNGES